MRSILPCSDSRAIPSSPLKLEWKIGLPWANTWGRLYSLSKLENPATTPETPRGSPVIPRWGPCPLQHLKEVPRSVLKCKTVLAPLMRPQKFLDTPVWLGWTYSKRKQRKIKLKAANAKFRACRKYQLVKNSCQNKTLVLIEMIFLTKFERNCDDES